MHRLVLILMTVISLLSRDAQAAEPPTVLIVFDGSGSMWGKPDGESKSKLVIARDAVQQALAKLPADARIGLLSYGHRRGGDCSDAEVILKPQSRAAERVGAAIEKLNPRGRGPITAALREAVAELGPQSAPSSVILIHDDLDNCQLDPCSTVGELRRAHPKVIVHVVSLAMKRADAQKMQCFSKATGGIHAEVSSSERAQAAIESMLKTATPDMPRGFDAPAPSAAAPQIVPTAPPTGSGLRLAASLVAGGPALDAPLRWRVRKDGDTTSAPVFEGDGASPVLDLPPGRYTAEVQFGFVVARSVIDVVAGVPQTSTVPLGAGTVQLTASPLSSPSAHPMSVSFARTDADEPAALLRDLVSEVALVPGAYRVTFIAGALRIDRGVTVVAGQRTPINPLLNVGEIDLSVQLANGEPAAQAVLSILEDDPDAPLGRREVVRAAADSGHFTLPAGSYQAVARRGLVEGRDRFVVRAGDRERRTIKLEAARLSVTARLPGRPDASDNIFLRVEQLDDAKDMEQVNGTTGQFELPAGRYRVSARVGLGNVKIERDVDLKPNSREQLTLDLPAGGLKLRWIETSNGLPIADVAWEIRDSAGRSVWLGSQTEARPLLLQGRYSVRAETRNRQLTRDVDVKSGETKSVDIGEQ